MFQIYQQRPIAAWTFTIGVGLVILWWLFGSYFSGNNATDTTAYVSNGGVDPNTALQYGYAATAQQAQANNDSKAIDAQVTLGLAQLAAQQQVAQLNAQNDANAALYGYNLGVKQLDTQKEMFSVQTAAATHANDLNAQLTQQLEKDNHDLNALLINSNTFTNIVAAGVASGVSRGSLTAILDRMPQGTSSPQG